jgi:hypothetical protein
VPTSTGAWKWLAIVTRGSSSRARRDNGLYNIVTINNGGNSTWTFSGNTRPRITADRIAGQPISGGHHSPAPGGEPSGPRGNTVTRHHDQLAESCAYEDQLE